MSRQNKMDLLMARAANQGDQVVDGAQVDSSAKHLMQQLEGMVNQTRAENEGLQAEVQAMAKRCIENDVNFRAIQEMLKDHEVKLNHLVQTKQVLLNGIQASKMAMDNVPQQKIVKVENAKNCNGKLMQLQTELAQLEAMQRQWTATDRRVQGHQFELNALCKCEAELNAKLKKINSQVTSNQK